jgi:hypothetical protein
VRKDSGELAPTSYVIADRGDLLAEANWSVHRSASAVRHELEGWLRVREHLFAWPDESGEQNLTVCRSDLPTTWYSKGREVGRNGCEDHNDNLLVVGCS